MLNRTFGCVRVVWNRTLAARHARYATERRGTSYAETDRALTLMKREPELAWLSEVSSVPLQQALRHQHAGLPTYQVFADQLKTGQTRPTIPAYAAVSQALSDAISDALSGKMTPAQALAQAASKGNQAIAAGTGSYAPLATPMTAAFTTIAFLQNWNNFLFPLVVTSSEKLMMISQGLTIFQGQLTQVSWNLLMAGSLIAVIPVLIVAMFAQRKVVDGLTLGAIR